MREHETEPALDLPASTARRGRVPRGLLVAAVAVPLLGIVLLAAALQQLGSAGSPNTTGPTAADFDAQAVAENRPAPSFVLPSLQGPGSVSLRSLAGKVVVVNIWASWCPPCREEAPQLEEVWTRFRFRGVRFVGVDHQDSRGAGIAFMRKFGITYPSAFDPRGTVAARYGALGIPTTFVIDRRGRIVYRFLGKTRSSILAPILDQVLASGL